MNKAFKIIWNTARGGYVVASEMQRAHGKTSRVKTAAAFALAGALALSATVTAKTITNDSIQKETTTKLISGDGELNIETAGDLRQLAEALKTSKLDAIRAALGVGSNAAGSTVTLVGAAGGKQYIDDGTLTFLKKVTESPLLSSLPQMPALKLVYEKLVHQSKPTSGDEIIKESGTKVIVGESGQTPLVLGLTGADNVLNVGIDTTNLNPLIILFTGEIKSHPLDVTQNGDSEITAHSGNLLAVTGGSVALNVNGPYLKASGFTVPLAAPSTTATVDGSTTITLQGSTTSAAVFTGGSAIALGGEATSNVTGTSHLSIGTKASPAGYEGMTLGAFGGGLSAATMGRTAASKVEQDTTVTITDGMAAGVFGGGAAMAAEFDGVWALLKGPLGHYADYIDWKGDTLHVAGTAETISRNVSMTVGGQAQTAGLAGGGLAVSSAGTDQAKAITTAKVGDVEITLGDADGSSIDAAAKSQLVGGVKEVLTLAKKLTEGGLSDITLSGAQETLGKLVAPNVHVGTIGGGAAIARTNPKLNQNSAAKSQAAAEAGNVTLNILSGYNVGTMAAGVALASGALSTKNAVKATSSVKSTAVNVLGGENVLLMGGGGAYATGSVDGLYGGGMAIDDTNSEAVNAVANTKDVVIAVTGGEVNRANMDVILNTAHGNKPNSVLPPSNGSYAHESADLAKTADAAILGAGVATGAGASVATETVQINLTGGTVNGSVFGGGAATIGGSSKVTQTVITVDGSAVSGSVYGGGLAGSTNNSGYTGSEAYSRAASSVEAATVNLVSGSVTGDVYAGGYLYQGSNGAQSTVTEGTINLYSADVFQGQKLSGNGAQTAALNVGRFSKDFEETVKLEGFTTITGSGGDLTNLEFSYGDKTESTIAGGSFFFTGVEPNAANSGKTLSIGSETAPAAAAFADIANAGKVLVTAGSTLGLGSGADLLSQTKRAAALTSNTPAVYASGNADLTRSTILAGAGTASAGLVVHNGTLVVDAAGKTNITNGTVTLEGDSILYFHNVGINLADGETTQTGSLTLADAPSTVKVDNILWKYVYGTDTYTLAQKSAEEVAQTTGIKTAGVIDFYNRLPSVSPLKDRIKDEFFLGEANLKGGMNLAAAAGVQAAALQGLGLATDTAQKRASLSQTFVDGVTSFAEVSGTRLDLGGNSSMNEINAELGGVIVGGEWTRSDMTFGGLANLGSGSVRGQSANAGVKNDVDYYGASLYAGKRFGQFYLVGQAGYLRTSNDLTDSSVGYAKVDSVKTNVWTIGVRGEAAVQLYENSQLIPYVGLTYVRLNTDDYTVSNGTHVSSTHQNLWTVPVGLMFTGKTAAASGWNLQPLLDVAYVRSFGDKDVEATTTWGSTVGSVNMDVWAENVLRSRAGIEAQKGALSLGIQGGAACGSDNMSSFFAQISARYSF
ncbi:autotransporter domain-containing protein [Sutterella wadsworthensis]|uniref:autotransporter domain-containing protein n=1 Tax=Sutterella wadsworthensis TaxID=40545 RepID=UPI003A8E094D